jgi:hypothetical protein
MKVGRQRNKRRADDLTTEDERWEGGGGGDWPAGQSNGHHKQIKAARK